MHSPVRAWHIIFRTVYTMASAPDLPQHRKSHFDFTVVSCLRWQNLVAGRCEKEQIDFDLGDAYLLGCMITKLIESILGEVSVFGGSLDVKGTLCYIELNEVYMAFGLLIRLFLQLVDKSRINGYNHHVTTRARSYSPEQHCVKYYSLVWARSREYKK